MTESNVQEVPGSPWEKPCANCNALNAGCFIPKRAGLAYGVSRTAQWPHQCSPGILLFEAGHFYYFARDSRADLNPPLMDDLSPYRN